MTKIKCVVKECLHYTAQGICDRHQRERVKYGLGKYEVDSNILADSLFHLIVEERSQFNAIGCRHVPQRQGAE